MKKFLFSSFCAFTLVLLIGCASKQNTMQKEEQMTIAKVQKDIKIGMSSSDVVEILGSPNMVTTDSKRRETWVYDKVSSRASASSSGFGWSLILLGGGKNNADVSSNQKTLTIIIKFDESQMVRDVAYRTSSF